jgi:hypothetical protein
MEVSAPVVLKSSHALSVADHPLLTLFAEAYNQRYEGRQQGSTAAAALPADIG